MFKYLSIITNHLFFCESEPILLCDESSQLNLSSDSNSSIYQA